MNKKRAGCIVVWLLLFGMLTGCTPLKQTGEFAREAGRTVKRAVTSKISDDTKTDVSGKKQEQDTSDGQQTDSDGQQTDLTGQQADEAASTERKTSSAEQISGENYAYQTLDENTKTVYDEILQTLLEQKEKTEVSTTDTAVLEHAYKAVCADYGGLFWVSGYMYTQYTKGGELVSMEFTPKYTMDQQTRQQTQGQIDASVAELLAGISASDSDYAKAKYVFEILIQNVDYDASAENNQNIISAFLSRATVCQGYACATQYLLRQLGIQSCIVTGKANGESHAWNLVRLDGDYYYMDTTWGNSRYLNGGTETAKYINYSYLAVTTEEIGRTHTFDDTFSLPVCVSTDDNYFVQEGRYFTEWDPDAAGKILADDYAANRQESAIRFATPQLYQTALKELIEQQRITDYCPDMTSVSYLEDADQQVLTFHFGA